MGEIRMTQDQGDRLNDSPAKIVLDLLEDEGSLTKTGRQMIERFIKTWSCDVLAALTETHLLTEVILTQKLAHAFQLPIVKGLLSYTVVPESLTSLPFVRARTWEMILLAQGDDQKVLVVANPACTQRLAQVRQEFKLGFTLSVGERSDIVRAIDELYPLAAQLPNLHGV